LTQGLNRQIRRMCEYLGYEVTRLKRTRIMNVKLDIPTGEWRDLTPQEVRTINEMVSDSTKTTVPSEKAPSVKNKFSGSPKPKSGSGREEKKKNFRNNKS